MAKINAFQSHSTSNVNSVAQYGALAALDLPETYYAELREVYKKRAESAVRTCEKYLPKAKICIPGGAFYLWIDVSGYGVDGNQFCERAVTEAYVLGVPGEEFGSKNHVRFSIACSEDYFIKALEKLSKIF